jgi:hypothetical protein
LKVYLVEAFDAEPYSQISWIDSVFDSLEKAQAYINANKNEMGWSKEIKDDEEGGYGHYLSDYIAVKEVQ